VTKKQGDSVILSKLLLSQDLLHATMKNLLRGGVQASIIHGTISLDNENWLPTVVVG
jgi:hypothetical protein